MIKVKDLDFTSENKKILDSFSYTFPDECINFVIGENGAGKTTLLNVLAGVLDSGGEKATDIGNITTDNHEYKKKMGFLMENPFFYEDLTPDEFIRLILSLRKISAEQTDLQRWYDLFNLNGLMHSPIRSLSKGAKQKTAIVGSLVHNPQYILMDEPVNGLDPVGVRILKEILIAEKKKGRTIIVSTHILEIAEKLADNVVVMKEGRMIASGSIKELRKKNDEELEDIFLRLTGNHDYEKVLDLI